MIGSHESSVGEGPALSRGQVSFTNPKNSSAMRVNRNRFTLVDGVTLVAAFALKVWLEVSFSFLERFTHGSTTV
jgi:hypothetical protein